MTHDPDQQTGPAPIAERSTYSDPAVQAAIREATSAPPAITEVTTLRAMVRPPGELADLREQIKRGQAMYEATVAQRDARIKVLEEAGRLISEGAEKTRTERDELADKVDELEAVIAHRTSWSSGRIDPTPGQITTYLKAANAVVEQGGGVMYSPTAIRAGLAAVQFALLNPPTDGEPVAPGDVRPGDILTYTAPVSYVAGGFAFSADGHEIRLTAPGATVTRPTTPPPTEPGTLIEATVHGRTVQLTLTDDTSPDPWFVIAGHVPGFCRWVAAGDLTAVRVLSTPNTPTGDTP